MYCFHGATFDTESVTNAKLGVGTRRVTYVLLDRPVLARYVRIQAIEPGRESWAVADISMQ